MSSRAEEGPKATRGARNVLPECVLHKLARHATCCEHRSGQWAKHRPPKRTCTPGPVCPNPYAPHDQKQATAIQVHRSVEMWPVSVRKVRDNGVTMVTSSIKRRVSGQLSKDGKKKQTEDDGWRNFNPPTILSDAAHCRTVQLLKKGQEIWLNW